ncbi:hypothetical protein MMC09_002145 [Bachmanniomyces sp. S44760]|nr:hypothetical protein [Bachmanniomyces sp. S44760]
MSSRSRSQSPPLKGPSRPGLLSDHKRVTRLRKDLFRSRLRLKEKRNEWSDERDAIIEIDDKIMEFVRQFRENPKIHDTDRLESLYAEYLVKRDEVGTLQYEYDEAEEEHNAIEAKLQKAEQLLYRAGQSLAADTSIEGDSDDPLSPNESNSSIESVESTEAERLLHRYQSRLVDARDVQERTVDLWFEYNQTLRLAMTRHNIGMGSERSLTEPMEEYSNVRLQAEEDLKIIEADIDLLAQLTEAAGLQVTRPERRQLPELRIPTLSVSSQTSEHPSSRTRLSDSVLVQTDFVKDIALTRSKIDKWISLRLQNSPVEQAQQKAILETMTDKTADDETWARRILDCRRRDPLKADLPQKSANSSSQWDTNTELDTRDDNFDIMPTSETTRVIDDFYKQFPPPSHESRKSRRVSSPPRPYRNNLQTNSSIPSFNDGAKPRTSHSIQAFKDINRQSVVLPSHISQNSNRSLPGPSRNETFHNIPSADSLRATALPWSGKSLRRSLQSADMELPELDQSVVTRSSKSMYKEAPYIGFLDLEMLDEYESRSV